MVQEAYLASLLPPSEARDCLNKLMVVASDPREVASNRQDALTGAAWHRMQTIACDGLSPRASRARRERR